MFLKSAPFFNSASHGTEDSAEEKNVLSDEGEQDFHAARMEALETELAQMTTKYHETHERMLRIAAEAENTRKRMDKEKVDTRLYAIQEFAKDLLPVIDAFDKALVIIEETQAKKNDADSSQTSAIVEGVQMVTKSFQDAIKKHGIERLPGKGTPFNPMFHNAIAKIADPSLTQETVIDEFMAGYKIADRILRTAMVRVGAPD